MGSNPDRNAKISQARRGMKFSDEHKNKIRLAVLGTKATSETRALLSRMRKGKRMSEKQKTDISATNKRLGLSYNRYPTPPQEAIHRVLGPDWEMKYVIGTGTIFGAKWYKADIANSSEKLIIELDGRNHVTQAHLDRDAKRDAHLRELGWKTIRLRNEEALEICSKPNAHEILWHMCRK